MKVPSENVKSFMALRVMLTDKPSNQDARLVNKCKDTYEHSILPYVDTP